MAKRRSRQEIETEPTRKLSASESKEQLLYLWKIVGFQKAKIFGALLLLIVSSTGGLAFPLIIGKLVDSVTALNPQYSAGELALGLIVILIAQSITRYFVGTMLISISERSLATLRTKVYDKILRLPMSYLTEQRVGELTSRLTSDVTIIQETFSFTFLELLRQTVFLIGGIALIATKSLHLTGMILLSVPPLALAGMYFGKKIRAHSKDAQQAAAEATTVVEESLQAIVSVKSFRNENHELTRYSSAIQRGVALSIRGAKMRSAFVSFILFSLFGGIAGVIWYGGTLVRSGQMTIGDLTSFLMYAMFVGGAFGSLAELFGQIQKTLGVTERIREIFSETTEEVHNVSSMQQATLRRLQSVEFTNVSFRYPGRGEKNTLHEISLSVPAGKRVAFVGESGAGKSTTAALIQALYEPNSGEITFDGIPAQQLRLDDIRQSVGIVPQDIVLFGGTITDNIRYGKLDATDEEIRFAAEMANALEFIESFPLKFDTIVGERGQKLSGGQRQRIAIARAILKNPSILILDEATSSLDSNTEHLIQEAMERLMAHRTTIIIAHRLSTVRKCDEIFVFQSGTIIERGTHSQLLENKENAYAKLIALQFGETE